MTRLIDSRLTAYLERLPKYHSHMLNLRAAAAVNKRTASILEAHAYLGIKLCESNRWLGRLSQLAATLSNVEGKSEARRLQSLSSQADAFLFATYGGLDALAQEIVAVHTFEPTEEVKFPALERMLRESCDHPGACEALRAQLSRTCDASWFRDLRRLRNLVNFRSLLATTAGNDSLTPFHIGEPDQDLGGPGQLADFAAFMHRAVVETVEAALETMAREGMLDLV